MCSLLYWLVFTHPALLKWNWRIIRTDTSWLRGYWRLWTGFFESDLEIYTACFPVGHTSGLSTLLCVYQSMLPDLRVKEQRGQKSASLLLDYRHRHMWEVPNYVVKENGGWWSDFWQWDESDGNAFLNARVRALRECLRPEPVPMWILCTVAILWCRVKKNVTSGVNKQYLCQKELNMYLWSTSILLRRKMFCKV